MLELIKEEEQANVELAVLKRELEIDQRMHEHEKSKLDEKRKVEEKDAIKLEKEKERLNIELSALKKEFEIAKKKHELHCLQMEIEAKDVRAELEVKIKEPGSVLEDSRSKVKMLEEYSESKQQTWKKEELNFQGLQHASYQMNFINTYSIHYLSIYIINHSFVFIWQDSASKTS